MRKRGTSLPNRISTEQPDYGAITAAVIAAGGIAAIPTETSYGLAADPFNAAALRRLFAIKERPLTKPLLVLIGDLSVLPRLSASTPECYIPLIKRYWPGPLTLIFPAGTSLPEQLTAGTGTVGVRWSSNPIATEICRCSGGTVTGTSANMSGQRSAYSAEDITAYFGDRIDIVVDGGTLQKRPGSSIIGCRNEHLTCIRDGAIPFASIRKTAERGGYRVN